jgi:hypothetical protein
MKFAIIALCCRSSHSRVCRICGRHALKVLPFREGIFHRSLGWSSILGSRNRSAGD